jgi:MtaA/CmuA family methyltransferase
LGAPITDDDTKTPALTAPALESLDKLDELPWKAALEDPIAINTSSHLIGQAIGDEAFVMPTQWGPFTTAARIIGAEPLMIAITQEPDALKELIKESADFVWAMSEKMLAHSNVMGVNFSEPIASGDLISPATFEQFVEPDLRDLINKTKAAGKYAMVHICGNTTPLLPKIKDMAPQAFSLEAKVDLEVAKEVLGGQICVLGNVPPTECFLTGSPDEVIAEAANCLKIWGDDPGYILTVGCDFPKEVPLDNIKALMSLKG